MAPHAHTAPRTPARVPLQSSRTPRRRRLRPSWRSCSSACLLPRSCHRLGVLRSLPCSQLASLRREKELLNEQCMQQARAVGELKRKLQYVWPWHLRFCMRSIDGWLAGKPWWA